MEHYSDYLQPQPGYKPVMTKEEINKSPETWLNFYPHQTFVKILTTLLSQFESGDKSLWMYGAYGTGKSHAALVIQKIFNDADERVEEFFERYKNCFNQVLVENIRKWRSKKVLAVYEYGTDTVYNPNQFIMHIERAIQQACAQAGYKVSALSSSQQILQRIKDDERRFFSKRDEIQDGLQYLTPNIDSYAKFEAACNKGVGVLADGLLSEAEKVLEHDCIYLNQDAGQLLQWINSICAENGVGKIVFLWDEFSSYIDHAKGDLKTFEQMGESLAQQCNFHFVPITHMALSAFLADGAESAKKAKNRYEFRALEIPTDQVFQLGAHAFKISNEQEWFKARELLWADVNNLVEHYVRPHMSQGDEVTNEAFKGILPLHPMSAFLLMNLSGKIGANQRSFFDYLCKQDSESEFQRFLHEGGPAIANHQFLMVDYLWHYFIDNDELSQDKAVVEIKGEYNSKSHALRMEQGSPEERVYRATLLYSLMEKMGGSGTLELLQPTVENIERSFCGDGAIVNVKQILSDLENKHCFSIQNGHVIPLIAGDKVDGSKYLENFNGLVANNCSDVLRQQTVQSGDSLRYDAKAFDGTTYKQSDFNKRADYGESEKGSALKQGNKVMLHFLLAKDAQGKLDIPEKAKQMARQFGGFRIIYAYFPNLSFCDKNKDQWKDFADMYAQEMAASNESTRGGVHRLLEKIRDEWRDSLKASNVVIDMVIPGEKSGDEPYLLQNLTWVSFRKELCKQKDKWFYYSPDVYSGYNISAFKPTPSGLAGWARAGLNGTRSGVFQGVLASFERNDIAIDANWFATQPEHPITKLRDLLENKLKNAISGGGSASLRRMYKELQRAPWGLERNAYSAFILGFTMKEWLTKNLQWTNKQISQQLDVDSLADIIEKVVLADSVEDLKDERLICRLSKEEKEFIKRINEIFNLEADGNATPESVLNNLAIKVGERTGRIPIWVLPAYVKSIPTENGAELIGEVVNNLSEIMKISSKAKDSQSQKSEKIRKIGELLLNNDGLVDALNKYINPQSFGVAFDYYLKEQCPELVELVSQTHDQTFEYRKTIINKFAQEASWLWNEGDVASVLDDVVNQYKIISLVQQLLSIDGWLDFEGAQQKIQKIMVQDNRVSLELLALSYPFVTTIWNGASERKVHGETLSKFTEQAIATKDDFVALFRDPTKNKIIEILKKSLENLAADIAGDEWLEILAKLPDDAAKMPENSFRQTLSNVIKMHRESSEGQKLATFWQKKTGSKDPFDWSAVNSLPAEVLFADEQLAKIILMPFKAGKSCPVETIKEATKNLEKAVIANSAEQKKNFLDRNLPRRYGKLAVAAVDLARFFLEHLGADPNSWRDNSNRENVVHSFIKQHYEVALLPVVEKSVYAMSADEAKEKLLELLKIVPDAGIELLEKQ